MASKWKPHGKPKPGASGEDLRREVLRLIEKGHLKDAVKQAKLCFREDGTEEKRRLMERAYFLRAQQLHRDGMPASAQEVAQHLIGFGVTDPSLVGGFAQLLAALGMSRAALAFGDRLESPESRAKIVCAAADQVVLHPERAPAATPEIRAGAALVRGALEALEAGDEAKALTDLRDVARSSPFADWRLFARGLAAYYRRDLDEAHANWDRLDSDRAASRIARALRGLGDPAQEGSGSPAAALLDLEGRVLGEPILADLRGLQDLVAQDHWKDAVRLLGGLNTRSRRVDPAIPGRITWVLYFPLIRKARKARYGEAHAVVASFVKTAEPLPIDPKWNRLWAMIWEGPQGETEGAEDYWRAYLRDLEGLPNFSAEERRLAQALVWKHIGSLHIDDAEADAEGGSFFAPPRSKREIEDARRRAIACLEESLRLAPAHLPTHLLVRQAYEDWEQPEPAAAASRRLLEADPEHFETLVYLARQHLGRDEPQPALDYARRARMLKPLDRAVADLEWTVLVALARHRARAKQWDEGRAAFQEAERVSPDSREAFHFLAKRAVFELKAGQPDAAEELIRRAQDRLAEPAPAWLVLLVESIRYGLSKAHKDRFADQFKTALKKKCRSETAGELASTMGAYLAANVEYTGRDTHARQVVDYLRRTSKVKYRRADLRQVCQFLDAMPDEAKLLEKMVVRGIKDFPDDPYFRFLVGELEIRQGPFHCDRRYARTQLEKALELAQASGDPDDAALVPQIKETLTMIAELTDGPPGMPFGGPLPMPRLPNPLGLPPELFQMFQDLGIDPDGPFGPDFDDAPPRARPGGRGKARKKR